MPYLLGLENTAKLLHSLLVFEDVDVLRRLVDDVVPHVVRQLHVLFDELLLLLRVCGRRDHVADRLIERVHLQEDKLCIEEKSEMSQGMMTAYLLRLKIADDGVDVAEQLVYERHHFPHLDLYKLPPALLRNLDEGVARHVLHSLVGLVHELE